jgi:alcohol dehydrogenase
MKAIQLESPGNFRIIDAPAAPRPGPGEALVRVHRVGICGTDYGGFLGKMPFYSYPRIPGHELGVEITAIGEGVTNLRVGDRACIEPYINCQSCYACRCERTNCCEKLEVLGVHRDGGLRPEFIVPARKLHVSSKLAFEQLALVETLAIGCHAVQRGQPKSGEHVLVVGAGPIGLSVIEFARLSGAKTIVMDMNETRLRFVRDRMKITDTILTRNDGEELKQLADATNGQLADAVIDATGSNKSMGQALNYCAFGGRLVFVGITQQEVSFPHAPVMHRREITILASRNALPPDFARIIKLIEDGQIDTRPWITHHSDFDGMIKAFPSWMLPETGVIKAMVQVN